MSSLKWDSIIIKMIMDKWPNFLAFTFKEFPFPVDRYIEYVDGNVVSEGEIHFMIKFKQHNGGNYHQEGLITVDLENNPLENKILSHFEFDNCVTMGDRLMFYINAEQSNVEDVAIQMVGMLMGTTREEKNYVENEPIIGNVFTVDYKVARVSFRFVNPDRLIEFY